MASPMDALPDSVLLKIFSHLDALNARSVLACVCRRFSLLSQDHCWRRKLRVTCDEIERTMYKELNCRRLGNNFLIREVMQSKMLQSLVFDDFMERFGTQNYDHIISDNRIPFYNNVFAILNKILVMCTELNELQCTVHRNKCILKADKLDSLKFIRLDTEDNLIFDEIAKNLQVRYSKIEFKGSTETLEHLVSASKNTMQVLIISGVSMTDGVVNSLNACEKLFRLALYSEITVPQECLRIALPELTVPALAILIDDPHLNNPFTLAPALVRVFFNRHRKMLDIQTRAIKDFENKLFELCPNLEHLTILHMRAGDFQFAIFKKLLSHFRYHARCNCLELRGLITMEIIGKLENEVLVKNPGLECDFYSQQNDEYLLVIKKATNSTAKSILRR